MYDTYMYVYTYIKTRIWRARTQDGGYAWNACHACHACHACALEGESRVQGRTGISKQSQFTRRREEEGSKIQRLYIVYI
jgi:hypothetical protein